MASVGSGMTALSIAAFRPSQSAETVADYTHPAGDALILRAVRLVCRGQVCCDQANTQDCGH